MSAIANRGVLMKPLVVNRYEDETGAVVMRFEPQTVRRVCSEQAAKLMVQALKTVVGTMARRARRIWRTIRLRGRPAPQKRTMAESIWMASTFHRLLGSSPPTTQNCASRW